MDNWKKRKKSHRKDDIIAAVAFMCMAILGMVMIAISFLTEKGIE